MSVPRLLSPELLWLLEGFPMATQVPAGLCQSPVTPECWWSRPLLPSGKDLALSTRR